MQIPIMKHVCKIKQNLYEDRFSVQKQMIGSHALQNINEINKEIILCKNPNNQEMMYRFE